MNSRTSHEGNSYHMYLSFYGLNESPFTLNPDPDFLYLSEMHQAALARMECSLLNQAPFTVLSGNIGMGKTTLIRHLLHLMYKDTQYTVGLVTNTHATVDDLINWILFSFGLDYQSNNSVKAHHIFYDFLVSEYAKNRQVILIIDEAQNLNVDALEELRLISNININKHQVLQTFLAGQENLLETLKKPELIQFSQRIAYSYHLEPFNRFDTHAYILHRLEIAGAQYRQIFSIEAADLLYQYSKGIPRLINVLCDTALIYGFADEKQYIDADLISDVILDKKQESILPFGKRISYLGAQIPDEITSLYTTMAKRAATLKEQIKKNQKKKSELWALDFNQKINQHQDKHRLQTATGSNFFSTDRSISPKDEHSKSTVIQESIRFLSSLFSKIKDYWQRFTDWCLTKWVRWRGWTLLRWEFLKNRCMESLKRIDNWRLAGHGSPSRIIGYAMLLNGGGLLLLLSSIFIDNWSFNKPQSPATQVAKAELTALNQPNRSNEPTNQPTIKTEKDNHALSDKRISLYRIKGDTLDTSPDKSSSFNFSKSSYRSAKANQQLSEANQRNERTVVVREGDNIYRILTREFGEYNSNLLNNILRENPNIKDVDRIMVGQAIKLPRG